MLQSFKKCYVLHFAITLVTPQGCKALIYMMKDIIPPSPPSGNGFRIFTKSFKNPIGGKSTETPTPLANEFELSLTHTLASSQLLHYLTCSGCFTVKNSEASAESLHPASASRPLAARMTSAVIPHRNLVKTWKGSPSLIVPARASNKTSLGLFNIGK